MEHISRGVLPSMQTAILVSDCSRRGIQAVGRIAKLIDECGMKPDTVGLIVNRAPGGKLNAGIQEEIENQGFADYYVDHAVGIWPQSAGGIPFNSCEFQSKGDPITDMFESMAAEQKARSTYDNILRVVRDIPEIADPIRFLRAREVVHFQRFGEALQSLQDQLNSKNFYQMNPSFDIGLTREPCDCQGECVQ